MYVYETLFTKLFIYFQPCITPSVPEVSLVFSNVPWVNDRTATSTNISPGYLCRETSVQERRNVVPSTGHGRENSNCGNYQPYFNHEENKLLRHSNHKHDGISGKTNSDYFDLSRANILRDNRAIENEVVTNSNRTFLPRAFSNNCNTPNLNRDINSALQSSYGNDNSISNRIHNRFQYRHNGSPKINEHERSVQHDVNGPRNNQDFTYYSRSEGDECRVAKSYYKIHPRKKNSEQKFPSDREDEKQIKCHFNKETSSPHQQLTHLRGDQLRISQERTGAECSASMQDSVVNDQEDFVAPLPCSLFPHEQEKGRGIKSSPGTDLRSENQFQFRFLAHQTENLNLETRLDGRKASSPTQYRNVRDISENVRTSQTLLKKGKELYSDDKSLSDIYTLIHAQNEQLRHLQAQVDMLLLTRDTSSSAVTPSCAGIHSMKKHVPVVDESTQTTITDIHCDAAVSTDPSPVVSVGVMTMFTDTADSQEPREVKRTKRCNRKPRSGNR
jgi:hypothetical protein